MTDALTQAVSEERLRELVESALMAYSETQPDDETRMARMIAPISEMSELLALRSRPPTAAEAGVAVKPLEWRMHGYEGLGVGGISYAMCEGGSDGYEVYRPFHSVYKSHAEAQNAAQAHYTETILSALTTQPAESAKSGDGVTKQQVKAAAIEFLSHKGEQPFRVTRGGSYLWEECAPAMYSAITTALRESSHD